jgi:hypothetical protein
MKQRILQGWTITRVLYTLAGLFFIVQSFMDKQWPGVFLGAWFAAMGIFSFGCAAGYCAPSSMAKSSSEPTSADHISFEEVHSNKKISD